MIYAIVVVLVLILDQAIKYWTNVNLEIGGIKELIPGFIHLTNERNTGAAWGIFKDGRWLFVGLTIVACIVIIVALHNGYIKGKLGRWMIILVMAGGLGNFLDRLIYGYVVDMLEFDFQIFGKNFPVFNCADIFISICGIIFCIWLIFNREEELEAASGGPRPELHGSRDLGYDPRGVGKHESQQRGTDYITQMQRPVKQTRQLLEKERRDAERRAQEDALSQFETGSQPQRTARPQQGQAPAKSQQPASRAQAPAQGHSPQGRAQPAQGRTQPVVQAPPQARRPQGAPAQRPAQSAAQQPTARPRPQPAQGQGQARQAPAAQQRPAQAPAKAPAPKKSSTEFSLEDIMAEFSDK